MSDQKLLDLSDLTVEAIEVARADSLDSAIYGHGMPDLAASCGDTGCDCCNCGSGYLPQDWDWVEA